jgi:hypothetical protein
MRKTIIKNPKFVKKAGLWVLTTIEPADLKNKYEQHTYWGTEEELWKIKELLLEVLPNVSEKYSLFNLLKESAKANGISINTGVSQ